MSGGVGSFEAQCIASKETGRQGDRKTGRQGDRETGTQRDRDTGRQGNRKTGRQGHRKTGRQGDWEAGRQGDRETGRQGGWERGRQREESSAPASIEIYVLAVHSCPHLPRLAYARCSQSHQTSVVLAMAPLLSLPEYFGPCWMVERDPACVLRAACRARGGEALLASKYVPRQQEHRAACINKRTRNVYITIDTPKR